VLPPATLHAHYTPFSRSLRLLRFGLRHFRPSQRHAAFTFTSPATSTNQPPATSTNQPPAPTSHQPPATTTSASSVRKRVHLSSSFCSPPPWTWWTSLSRKFCSCVTPPLWQSKLGGVGHLVKMRNAPPSSSTPTPNHPSLKLSALRAIIQNHSHNVILSDHRDGRRV
jgi:hypothetical protein